MFCTVQISYVIYLVVLFVAVDVQSVRVRRRALRGYLIELSPKNKFTDWLRILGNPEQPTNFYGDNIKDDEDINICDYMRDSFGSYGDYSFMVTCEQKPAIHELHPEKPISVTVYFNKDLWRASTDKCLQSPEVLLANKLIVNSDEENNLQVTELPNPGNAFAYVMVFVTDQYFPCNRILRDKVDAQFRQKWQPQLDAELLYSNVRCENRDNPHHIEFDQYYNVSDADERLRMLEPQHADDDIISEFRKGHYRYPYASLATHYADLCGGEYKSGISSTMSSTVPTIWSTRSRNTSANTHTTAYITPDLQNTDNQNVVKSNQEAIKAAPKTKSSQSERMISSKVPYFFVIVSLHMM